MESDAKAVSGVDDPLEQEAFLASLPFRIFIWVGEAVSVIETGEVEVFLHMLARQRWCKSDSTRELLRQATECYTRNWQQYQRGDLKRELFPVQEAVETMRRGMPSDEAKLLVRDLDYLAHAIARSSSRFLGIGYIRKEQQRALNQLSVALDGQMPSEGRESAQPVPLEGPDAPQHASFMPLAVADPRRLSRWQKGKILVRCVEVIDDTHDVKTFRLIANPPVLFTFKPGQFLTLELQIDGKPVHRSYTISSTPSRPHALELTVKRVAGGRVSNWLHDNLHVGDSLSVKGPGGSFSFFDHPARKMLMISGGSGITPVMSMARWVCDTVADCDVVFLHAARTAADIIFRAELEMMDRRYANFHLFVTSSQAEPDQAPSELSGRITPEMVRKVAPDFAERTVYVCGPTGFMASARNIMKSLDHPMDNFHEESFGVSATETGRGQRHTKPGAPGSVLGLIPTPVRGARLRKLVGDLDLEADAARSAAPPATPQDIVVFAQSGKEIPGDEETTILELAQEHGVHIPSACLSGVCGTCKVRKTGGEVRAEASDGLEPDDVAAGYILTCVAWAKGRVVLDA